MKTQKGDILLEAILALTITIIIIMGIVVALIISISNSSFTTNQNLATSYAQEGLDVARNLKDTDFNSFANLPENYYCLAEGQRTISQGSSGNCYDNVAARFSRQIYINPSGGAGCGGSGAVFVASIVSWADSKCRNSTKCHKVELNSCFLGVN